MDGNKGRGADGNRRVYRHKMGIKAKNNTGASGPENVIRALKLTQLPHSYEIIMKDRALFSPSGAQLHPVFRGSPPRWALH